jgi:excisionase family DNA binding protein
MNTATTPPPDAALAYPITALRRVAGIGKTKAYKLIDEGRLEAIRSGGRTLISARSLRAYLDGLPRVMPKRRA